MPDDVKDALLDIFCRHGVMTPKEAQAYFRALEASNRFQQETWA
jgi:sulfite reductase alpha subunit-like flavoprotein